MKIGIMQPYFMPYIGYWQLLNAVDKYVIYDDVNFIKGGWINRNRILINGEAKFFNLPMIGASSNKLINEVSVNDNKKIMNKNLRIIEAAYKKAPYYEIIYPMIKKILMNKKGNIADFIAESFREICLYLNINTELIMSSSLDKNNELKGQAKVLEICSLLHGTEYYNAIGGQELYSFSDFKKHDLNLKFLKTENIEYEQYNNEFQSNLSIIDLLMFNSKDEIKEYLNRYTLVEEEQ